MLSEKCFEPYHGVAACIGGFQPLPTLQERMVLYLAAAMSSVLGIGISISIIVYDNDAVFLVLGLVHSIVFIVSGLFIHATKMRIILFGFYCCLFPLWGTLVGMCGVYMFSALTCSLVWGVIVVHIFEQRLGLILFAVIGLLPSIGIFLVGYVNNNGIPTAFFPVVIGYWHVAASIALVYLSLRKRNQMSLLSRNHCRVCGYSLLGLPTGTPCPECGSPRPPAAFASEL